MLDTAMLSKLKTSGKKMPNILTPDTPGIDEDGNRLFVAPRIICSWAQNIISEIAEHRHLKKAQVLVLIKVAPSVAKKLQKGERVQIGKAAKPSPTGKLLSMIGKGAEAADFVIILSGDWLQGIGIFNDAFDVCAKDLATVGKAMALIDHELLHCGAVIAGEFTEPAKIKSFVEELGDHHIETCEDVTDDEGRQLIRYYKTDGKNDFTWKMRKHDVEEFEGVVYRFGTWDRQLGRLVDVIKKSKPGLFDGAAA